MIGGTGTAHCLHVPSGQVRPLSSAGRIHAPGVKHLRRTPERPAITGRVPELSTGGGTSDARFIKDYCPVVEFGLVGQTMHKVDECVAVEALDRLAAIYKKFLLSYFSGADGN